MPMIRNWAPRLLVGLLLAGGVVTAQAQTSTGTSTGTTAGKTMTGAPTTTTPMATTPMTNAPMSSGAMKSTAPMAAPNGAMVNINTASATELDTLPQIGKVRAKKIIDGRPYKSTEDLVTKKVLTKGIFDKIKGRITAS